MPAMAADPTIRRQVMVAARELLSQDADAPLSRIADAAGVSRATFYRHFGSRAELLDSVSMAQPPDARTRILAAAEEMLVGTSLAELSMDGLAQAAGVSRGTLYRIFPGKAALMEGLVAAYSPFEEIRRIAIEDSGEPPAVFFSRIARAFVGAADEHLGLMRAIFHEATRGSDAAVAGIRPRLQETLGLLAGYVAEQQAAGRLRPMHPLLALQAIVGPIFFHLMTRPVAEEMVLLPMGIADAIDALVAASLEGVAA